MNRIATIFLAVTASLFFVGCYNDFDTPAPAKVWTDADFSDSKIISIKELKDIFEEAYPGTSGIGQSLTITDSLKFGKAVLNKLGKINKLHKNQVEQAGFAVLKAPDIPSILVETAFISNVEEERKLKTATFQQEVAESILAGIKAYFADGATLARRG